MIRSFARPEITTWRSRLHAPRSPVRNQPSGVNASSGALGHLPVAAEDVGTAHLDFADRPLRALAALRVDDAHLDTGQRGPTVPAIRGPSSGFDVFMPVSVSP